MRRPGRGPLLMVGASLAFTAMVGFVKVARAELDPLTVMAFRGAIAVPLAALLVREHGFRLRGHRVFAIRALMGFCAMFCFYTAAKGLTLADMTLLTRTQPILLALLAPLVLGKAERVGWSIWVLLAFGVAGTAILIAPDLAVGSVWGLWAIGATFFSAGAHLAVRALRESDHAVTIVFWFQIFVTVLAFSILALRGELSIPEASLWPWLLGAGVTATAGQIMMTGAYHSDRAAVVGAASYTGPVWGVLGDVIFFAALPSASELGGGALIVGAGLWLVLRGDRDQSERPTSPPRTET